MERIGEESWERLVGLGDAGGAVGEVVCVAGGHRHNHHRSCQYAGNKLPHLRPWRPHLWRC